jgi:hypothetical protein
MRRLAAVVAACLLTLSFAVPASADINVTTLTTTITKGAVHTYPSGSDWAPWGSCATGISAGQEYRCAFEFDLSSIISSSKITAATLTIRRTSGCPTNDCPIGIRSYTGNGSADLADVTASTANIATWKPANNLQHNVNVLSQIQAHRNNTEQWAGFILGRGASTRNPDVQQFSLSSSDLTLSITYIPFPVDVTVVKAGTGAGKVVSDSPGINCGSTCTGTFTYGQPLKLTATVVGSNIFVGWSGITCDEPGPASPTCTFIVPSVPGPITATFTSTATPTPRPTPRPSATPKPTPRATQAPTATPQTQAPTLGPAPTEIAQATFAPGETVGPTLAPATQPASDGGGPPIGVIILIAGIVLAIGVGAGAYLYARRQEMPPPGA